LNYKNHKDKVFCIFSFYRQKSCLNDLDPDIIPDLDQ
jgi:hypothetical protein